MDYLAAFVMGVAAASAVVVNLQLNRIEDRNEEAWSVIETQDVPSWFDRSLMPVLRKKLEEKSRGDILYMNTLYAHLSANGYFGDPTWDHLEKLCSVACDKVLRDKIQVDVVVGLASGGALIAPLVALLLGVPRENTHYMKFSKYSNKTNLQRLRTVLELGSADEHRARYVPEAYPAFECRGQRVLVVDDQSNSGSTLQLARSVLLGEAFGAADVKTMVLAQRVKLEHVDYSALENHYIQTWPWGQDA